MQVLHPSMGHAAWHSRCLLCALQATTGRLLVSCDHSTLQGLVTRLLPTEKCDVGYIMEHNKPTSPQCLCTHSTCLLFLSGSFRVTFCLGRCPRRSSFPQICGHCEYVLECGTGRCLPPSSWWATNGGAQADKPVRLHGMVSCVSPIAQP